MKCVFWYSLQLLPETFLILRSIQEDIMNVIGLHVKYPLFMFSVNEPWIFWTDFRNILKYQFSWKSVPWEQICSMRTDGHDEANSCFLQFCDCA
jgi:hypothetical protein